MHRSANRPKPVGIMVEWRENGDFLFTCRYRNPDELSGGRSPAVHERHAFSSMTSAMGNVLRKLRCEHISFPLFLVSLAIGHRHLLGEIDLLLQALHRHLDGQEQSGEYTCLVTAAEGE